LRLKRREVKKVKTESEMPGRCREEDVGEVKVKRWLEDVEKRMCGG
jgi:hypothetical protein